MTKTIAEQALAMAKEEFLACLFICMADNGHYKELKLQLANQFIFRTDSYPVDMAVALTLLKNFKSMKASKNNNNKNISSRAGTKNTVNDANEEGVGVACVQAKKDQCFI